jgi:hypothetical protein
MRQVEMRAEDGATRRILAAALVLVSVALVGACGSTPPPRPVEVPIDQFTTGPAPAGSPDPLSAGAAPIDAPAPQDTAGAAASGPPPTPLTTPTADGPAGATPLPAPPIPAAGAHAPPPKAQRLTATQCNQIMDRFIVLVGVTNGLTMAQAQKGLPTMRTQAQTDPNMANAESACVAQNSKKQFQCAIKAATVDAWKACLE